MPMMVLWMTLGPALGLQAEEVARDVSPAEQRPVPDFWRGRVEEVEAAVAEVKRGAVRVIARSPGQRPVFLVAYGEKDDFRSQANYNSACGAGNPAFYAEKTEATKPVVFFLGPVHGQEVEGIVGLVNLICVAETGRDRRGREWPELRAALDQCRVLIIPCANPDGRARCPFDSFVGLPVETMTKYGQGTRPDGTNYGWPEVKQVHPMKADGGLLGAYFNDAGVNLMHDEFFAPLAEETKALLQLARDEAPDYVAVLHTHGSAPAVLATDYVPRFIKERIQAFGNQLDARYAAAHLPHRPGPEPREDGTTFPPPSFNLTSALHHVCGAAAFTYECSHGLRGEPYPQVDFDQILDLQLLLYEELLKFALAHPVRWER